MTLQECLDRLDHALDTQRQRLARGEIARPEALASAKNAVDTLAAQNPQWAAEIRQHGALRLVLEDLSAQSQTHKAPPFLRANVRAALEKEAQKTPFWSRWPVLAPKFAWSGGLVAAGLFLLLVAQPFIVKEAQSPAPKSGSASVSVSDSAAAPANVAPVQKVAPKPAASAVESKTPSTFADATKAAPRMERADSSARKTVSGTPKTSSDAGKTVSGVAKNDSGARKPTSGARAKVSGDSNKTVRQTKFPSPTPKIAATPALSASDSRPKAPAIAEKAPAPLESARDAQSVEPRAAQPDFAPKTVPTASVLPFQISVSMAPTASKSRVFNMEPQNKMARGNSGGAGGFGAATENGFAAPLAPSAAAGARDKNARRDAKASDRLADDAAPAKMGENPENSAPAPIQPRVMMRRQMPMTMTQAQISPRVLSFKFSSSVAVSGVQIVVSAPKKGDEKPAFEPQILWSGDLVAQTPIEAQIALPVAQGAPLTATLEQKTEDGASKILATQDLVAP